MIRDYVKRDDLRNGWQLHKTVYMHDITPQYLTDLVLGHQFERNLYSRDNYLFNFPKISPKASERHFSHFKPTIWNPLPFTIRKKITQPLKFQEVIYHLSHFSSSFWRRH